MKKIVSILAMALSFTSVFAQDTNDAIKTQCQQFAFSFFDKVTQKDQDNICFSPLSLQIALAMAQNGASGETLRQMMAAVGLENYDVDAANLYFRELSETLTSRPDDFSKYLYRDKWESDEEYQQRCDAAFPICELANGVWIQNGFPVYDSFVKVLKDNFDAEAANVDFSTQEGIDRVNEWVNEKTHQLIPSVMEEPDPNLVMLLANALYFKGGWTSPFDEGSTKRQMFHNADGSLMEVDMMRQKEEMQMTTTDRYHIVRLPYGMKGEFSMTLFLPVDATWMPALTIDDWKAYGDRQHQNTSVLLSMPCFTTEGDYNLISLLKEMGMTDAFIAGQADFSKMTPLSVYISKVQQLSKIVVHELGTEAAALTVIEFDKSSIDPTVEEITFDRPFYYTIEHTPSGAVLFAGRVSKFDATTSHGSITHIAPLVNPSCPQGIYDLQGRRVPIPPQKGIYI